MSSYRCFGSWCRPVFTAASVAVFVLATGCASDEGAPRQAKAASGIRETKAELMQGSTQVDTTLAAMNALRGDDVNLPSAFKKFKSEVAASDKQAKQVRSRAQDMQARAAEYQKKWQEDRGEMTSPQLKESAKQRAAQIKSRYDGITRTASQARQAYDSYIKAVHDLETYLTNDLTPAAVTSAAPTFEKANTDGEKVKALINDLGGQLDAVASSLSATQM